MMILISKSIWNILLQSTVRLAQKEKIVLDPQVAAAVQAGELPREALSLIKSIPAKAEQDMKLTVSRWHHPYATTWY
jgi:hypothetical protein